MSVIHSYTVSRQVLHWYLFLTVDLQYLYGNCIKHVHWKFFRDHQALFEQVLQEGKFFPFYITAPI